MKNMDKDLVIVAGARTAMAEYSGTPGHGAFKDIPANDLGAVAVKGALDRAGVSPDAIDHVILGNALQTSADAIYGARHVGLKAGIPIETPALTVNRICGSGIQSVVTGCEQLLLGEAGYVVAGGMENMSQAPHVLRGARQGYRLGHEPKLEDLLMAALMDPFCGLFMAQTAEKLAGQYSIGREEQDEFALRSHKLGAEAVQEGRFAEEIVPVTVRKRREEIEWTEDDHIKPDTTMEGLAKLRPAFGKEGTVTAGNASGIVDGAAALVVTTAERASADGLEPWARVRSWAVAGVDPSIMGIGPAPSMRKACERAGVDIGDLDRIEINEAFSGQYLAVEKELELDRDKVNVNGGAIALGHPLGATGTRLLLTLTMELRRSDTDLGCASACIGGGQGIAMVVERL